MPEPGFYYGAMFISYIITGFLFLGIALSLVFIWGWTVEGAMGIVLLVAALIYIWILRLSRSVWIHIIVPFKRKTVSHLPKQKK